MAISRVSKYVGCLLLVGVLSGCIDHRNPSITPGATDARLRVKTITEELPDNKSWISQLSYDGQGRLVSILAFQTPDSTVARVERTTYQYDGNNLLTQVQRRIVTRQPLSPLSEETYTYTYNGTGQVASLAHAPSGRQLSFGSYSADGKPSSYSRPGSLSGLIISGGGSFTFTGSNLTMHSERLSVRRLGDPPSAPDYGYSFQRTFTYDDRINPFYGVFIIPAPGVDPGGAFPGSPNAFTNTYYGGTDNALTLSPNNVLTQVTTNSNTIVYQYQYNVANLPTARAKTVDGVLAETLRFTYEGY